MENCSTCFYTLEKIEPTKYWSYTCRTTTYLQNRLPYHSIQHFSIYKVLYGIITNYSFLRVFEFLVFPYLRAFVKHKLEPNQPSVFFLGVPLNIKGICALILLLEKLLFHAMRSFITTNFLSWRNFLMINSVLFKVTCFTWYLFVPL